MKIPKCCKNCVNKYRGACCCSLPAQCNEWVEDDEGFDNKTITVTFNPDDTLVEQNEFKEMASSKEVVILNRALELACQELSNAKEMLYSVDQEENLLEDRIEYYIAEARAEVENDN